MACDPVDTDRNAVNIDGQCQTGDVGSKCHQDADCKWANACNNDVCCPRVKYVGVSPPSTVKPVEFYTNNHTVLIGGTCYHGYDDDKCGNNADCQTGNGKYSGKCKSKRCIGGQLHPNPFFKSDPFFWTTSRKLMLVVGILVVVAVLYVGGRFIVHEYKKHEVAHKAEEDVVASES